MVKALLRFIDDIVELFFPKRHHKHHRYNHHHTQEFHSFRIVVGKPQEK